MNLYALNYVTGAMFLVSGIINIVDNNWAAVLPCFAACMYAIGFGALLRDKT